MRNLVIIPQITKKNSDSFVTYLQEIKRLGKKGNLTKVQEGELAQKISFGDTKAETELIERNLKFVISVAKQYQGYNCQLEDLVSEGNIGLIKAARRFDVSKECKFISYAVWWIRASILCYLNKNSRPIRLPIKKIAQLSIIKKFQAKFEQEFNRKPSTDEILDGMEIDMDFDQISNVFSINRGVQSLNNSISSDFEINGDTLESKISDEPQINSVLNEEDVKSVIKRILNKIPEKNKVVVELYYGLNGRKTHTLYEIGQQLQLTKERIRNIRNDALRHMGMKKNRNFLKQYVV